MKRLLDMQLDDPVDMFHLHRGKMKDNWKSITSNLSKWEDLEDKDNMEYMSLNITPRSPRAWSQKPNRNGEISLARLEVGPKQYLYRFYFYKNGKFRYHDLTSPWDGEESYLRNACLCSMNRLPEITMEDRGADVLLNFQYVLPKAERYLVNLYSWGPVMSNFNSNFHRLMNKDVFNGIRKILELEGYVFVSQ